MSLSWKKFQPFFKPRVLPTAEPRFLALSEITEMTAEPVALKEAAKLTAEGFVLPSAFIQAFWHHQDLDKKIKSIMAGVNLRHPRSLSAAAESINRLIARQSIPMTWEKEWTKLLVELKKKTNKSRLNLALYFGNTETGPAEWLPEFETGFSEGNVLKLLKQSLSALYNERYIREREQRGWSQARLQISAVVLLLPELSKKSNLLSVKISTTDPVSGNPALARIMVSNKISTRNYLLFKPALATKKSLLINDWENPLINETDLAKIIAPLIDLEKKNQPVAVNAEFDPDSSALRIKRLDFTPITGHLVPVECILKNTGPILNSGTFLGQGIAVGPLVVCRAKNSVPETGSLLVAKNLNDIPSDWLFEAAGLILEEASENILLKIKTENISIPVLLGARQATRKLRSGTVATLAAVNGIGNLYAGALPYEVKPVTLIVKQTKTELRSPQTVVSIDEFVTTIGSRHPLDYFIKKVGPEYARKLGEAIACTAAKQFPLRFTVALSSSVPRVLAEWQGGTKAERSLHLRPTARGAERYLQPAYRPVLLAEISALKQARDRFGLLNFDLQLPYCRSAHELEELLIVLNKEGLTRATGWRFSLATDMPGHALLTAALAKHLDELIFDIDSLVKSTTGERATALTPVRQKTVEAALAAITKVAHKEQTRVALSGSLLSREPKLVFSAIKSGIKTLVLNDHQVIAVRAAALEAERTLGNASGTNRQLLGAVAGFACLCAMLITVGAGCGQQPKVPASPQMTPAQIRAEIMSALAEEREKFLAEDTTATVSGFADFKVTHPRAYEATYSPTQFTLNDPAAGHELLFTALTKFGTTSSTDLMTDSGLSVKLFSFGEDTASTTPMVYVYEVELAPRKILKVDVSAPTPQIEKIIKSIKVF